MSCGEWRWVLERDVRLLLSSATPSDFQLTCQHSLPHQHLQLQQLQPAAAQTARGQAEKQRKALQQGVFQAHNKPKTSVIKALPEPVIQSTK